jgi:hypothetical protein
LTILDHPEQGAQTPAILMSVIPTLEDCGRNLISAAFAAAVST